MCGQGSLGWCRYLRMLSQGSQGIHGINKCIRGQGSQWSHGSSKFICGQGSPGWRRYLRQVSPGRLTCVFAIRGVSGVMGVASLFVVRGVQDGVGICVR